MSEDTTTTEKQMPNPQRFRWKNVAYYNNFNDAHEHRQRLEENDYVKVRRCGPDKSRFVVKLGTPIEGENK